LRDVNIIDKNSIEKILFEKYFSVSVSVSFSLMEIFGEGVAESEFAISGS
jgi:hypothetical protein